MKAFAIPILQKLLENWDTFHQTKDDNEEDSSSPRTRAPYALILAPTRELTMQISTVFQNLGKGIYKQLSASIGDNQTFRERALNVVSIVGGLSEEKQKRLLSSYKQIHILVATPGRLSELFENPDLTAFQDLSSIRFVVVDEADRMMEEGHFAEVKLIQIT